jgi:oligopeptidase A
MLRSFTSSAASRLRTTRLVTETSTAATRAFSRTAVASHARARTTTHSALPTLGLASRSLAARPLTIRRALATITDTKDPTRTYPKTNPEFATNPILNWHTFPNFAAIKAEHVVPAIEVLTKQIEATFQERSKRMTPTWEGTMGLSKYLVSIISITRCYFSFSIASHHT